MSGNKKYSGIKLSIGMIVKNEEKYLRRCLTALKPLLEQVSSELIIVDTGSTDTTVDIAKEFTDKVYFFKWCDDFSAARNETVRYSKGEWYMFLDADEIFEDVSEIVSFFNSGEYKKFNSASHSRREIFGENEQKDNIITTVMRLSKNSDKLRFKGIIHEAFIAFSPIKSINTCSGHYGYDYMNEPEKKKQKYERNIALLLKEHQKDPENMRTLAHMVKSYQSNGHVDETIKYLSIMYEIIQKRPTDKYMVFTYYVSILVRFKLKEYTQVLQLADEYFHTRKSIIATDIDVYWFCGRCYLELKEWDKAIAAFKKSIELYDLFKAGKLDKSDLLYNNLIVIKDDFHKSVSDYIAFATTNITTNATSKLTSQKTEEVGTRIKLSIGMIVKNEEKYLRRCLTALKPLLEQVSSELIIVDTGSTDTTVDIAKEFTDKVYFFKWCDDFSAARNETVRYSKGEWYMFLDADEIFEDVSEIVSFFNSGEYKKFNSASHMLKNLTREDEIKDIADSSLLRLVVHHNGMHFSGAIHESLNMVYPNKELAACSVHYGYCFENEPEKKQLKHERNLVPLLKEYEQNPNDMRVLAHMVKECRCVEDTDGALKYLDIMHELGLKNPDDGYFIFALDKSMAVHFKREEYAQVLQLADEYFQIRKSPIATDIDVYWFCGHCYTKLKECDKAIAAFKKSIELYDLFKAGKLDKSDLLYNNLSCVKGDFHQSVSGDITFAMLKLSSQGTDKPIYGTDSYINLQVLRYYDITNDVAQIQDLTNWFCTSFKDWSVTYSDVLYIAIKHDINLLPLLNAIDITLYGMMLNAMEAYHADGYIQILDSKTTTLISGTSVREIYWSCCLLEYLLLSKLEFTDERYLSLFLEYTNNLAIYMNTVYNPDILVADLISLLEPVYRFGYFMNEAFIASDNGDTVLYVKNLKQALSYYPVMKRPIELLLEQLRQAEEQAAAEQNEFAQYAAQIKQQLEKLVDAHQYAAAMEIIPTLEQLLPNDADVQRYKKECAQ